jgi:methionyl-tRNA formyltransferase
MEPQIVFMGSAEFALPVLQNLYKSYQVVGVVTQPDKPAGRGRSIESPAIKKLAFSLSLPITQPNSLREPGGLDQIKLWKPELIVVVAYGKILPQLLLDLPKFGCLNVHASLLPRWRGASPIQAAILAGDAKTGVTIMKMDSGLDTGPILAQEETEIKNDDTTQVLMERLSKTGAELLVNMLPDYLSGQIKPLLQTETRATRASLFKKGDGLLDFTEDAITLERKVRAFYPWPGTFIIWHSQPMKIIKAHIDLTKNIPPLKKEEIDGFPALGAKFGTLVFEIVQPAGKKPMPGDVFLRGVRDWKNN